MRPLAIKPLSVRRSLPLCLAVWQIRLTWHLMAQDFNLSAQQSRERLEQIAGLAVAQIRGALDGWELGLRDLDPSPTSAASHTKFPELYQIGPLIGLAGLGIAVILL